MNATKYFGYIALMYAILYFVGLELRMAVELWGWDPQLTLDAFAAGFTIAPIFVLAAIIGTHRCHHHGK